MSGWCSVAFHPRLSTALRMSIETQGSEDDGGWLKVVIGQFTGVASVEQQFSVIYRERLQGDY